MQPCHHSLPLTSYLAASATAAATAIATATASATATSALGAIVMLSLQA
jgi:hypothetical protein